MCMNIELVRIHMSIIVYVFFEVRSMRDMDCLVSRHLAVYRSPRVATRFDEKTQALYLRVLFFPESV